MIFLFESGLVVSIISVQKQTHAPCIGHCHRFESPMTILNVLDQIPIMLHGDGVERVQRAGRKINQKLTCYVTLEKSLSLLES